MGRFLGKCISLTWNRDATGCMTEELESNSIKNWSNMVCVNRRKKDVADLFEKCLKRQKRSYFKALRRCEVVRRIEQKVQEKKLNAL